MRKSRRRNKPAPKPANTPRDWLAQPWVVAALLFVVAFGLYANTLGNGFVWDDEALIVDNPQLREFDGERAREIFTTHFWHRTEQGGGLYRPLVTLSYHLDYQIYGLNPAGYHATNIFFNGATVVLVYVLLALLLSRPLALVAALVFAVSPLHTENVAWVAGRTDLMASAFMLATLVLFVAGRRSGKAMCYAGAAIALVLALLSKEVAAITPALLFAVGVAGAPDMSRASVFSAERRPDWLLGPLAALAVVAAFTIWRSLGLGLELEWYASPADGLLATLGLSVATFGAYGLKLIFPFWLNAEFEVAVPASITDPLIWVGLAFAGLIVAAVYRWRRSPVTWLALGFFTIPLAPRTQSDPDHRNGRRALSLPAVPGGGDRAGGPGDATTRKRTGRDSIEYPGLAASRRFRRVRASGWRPLGADDHPQRGLER